MIRHRRSILRRPGVGDGAGGFVVGGRDANHLEAGVLYSMALPLLVFAEDGVTGGGFDRGVTDVFVHHMPSPDMTAESRRGLQAVFQNWQASVRAHYYR